MALTEAEQRELEYLLHLEYLDQVKTDYAKYVEYAHDGLYKHAEHTKFICSNIQEAIDKRKKMLAGEIPMEVQYISFSIPPRHSKSMSITETAPSFFLGNFPNDRVIIAGYGQDLATDFSKKNKDKVVQFGEELFGIKLKDGSTASTDWDIAKINGRAVRGGCIARGILSGVTGKGADLLIIDDPIKTREEADSEVSRNKIWGEWVDSFSTRLHPGAIVIVIMTRWHEDDLIGRLSDKEYGRPLPWKHINLPLEAEEGDLMGRKQGEPLWPERFDKEFIETRKRYPASFNALFQGRPTSAEGNLVKREWWKRYSTLPKMPRIIMSIDAAFKGEENSDFVAIQTWGKSGINAYLLDRLKRRMDFPTTLRAIETMRRENARRGYDVSGIFIEDKANGSAIISMLRQKIPGIIAVNPQGGKIARVNAISDYIQAGNVWLPKDEAWVEEYIEEWAAFPKGKTDDEVDCTSQALNKLFYYEADLPNPSKPDIPWVFQDNVEESEDYISW